MRRWWGPASVVVVLLAACVSTEGLSNVGNDAGAEDGGGTDATTLTDAAGDAPLADASPDAAEASANCAALNARVPAPRFCDDLDTSDAGVAGWPISDLAEGGVLERVDTFGLSAPASLHVKTPGATSSEFRPAYVRRNFVGTVDRVRYELDAFFASAPATTGSFVAFANIHFPSTTLNYLDVRIEADKLAGGAVTARLQQTIEGQSSNQYIDTPLSDPLPIGRWFHVTVDVDLTTNPGKAKVSFDGTLEADVTLDPAYVPGTVGVSFGIRLGTAKGGTPGTVDGWEAYFDNAAVY